MPYSLRRAAVASALALTALPATAALPPQHQRIAELRAVLDRAGDLFGNTPIERIEHVRTDLYRLTAGPCHADATIVGLPMPRNMVGGRRFEVRMGARVCAR